MCGIAGVFNFDGRGVSPVLLESMAGALRHRGPDGEGCHRAHGVGLVHRRLAILDLEGGRQPMTTQDGRSWIVFNGEIYNYVELREELIQRGHPFATRSDTEVILHLYEESGQECVQALRGMFAFALWDPARQRMVLARDRVGIKPLYYYADADRLVFASELKALLLHPDVPREIDPIALSEFLTYLYIPSPRTAFKHIHKLPPAHVLVAERGSIRLSRYWRLPSSTERRAKADWREELEATLRESVRLHMRSDVPVGALLSGGVDSSLVVALASGHAGEPLRTFSVGFRENRISELPFARSVAERYHTRHTEFVLDPHRIEDLPGLLAHFDEPFGDSSAIPSSHIARVAAREVKVCLTGDGGDEGFAGYDAYALARSLQPADLVPLPLRRLLVAPLERRIPEWLPGKGRLRMLALPPADRYTEIMGSVDLSTREWLLSGDFKAATAGEHPYAAIRRLHASLSPHDEVARLQRIDVETYLPDDILAKVDRTSMLHSLEARVPLLDHKVLELAFRMPTRLKLGGGRTKKILLETLGGLLPEPVWKRGKQGFAIPLNAWLQGDLARLAREVFSDPRTRQRGIFEPRGLDRLLASQRRGARDLANEVWCALVLELWFRERMDSAPAPVHDAA